MVKKSKGYTKPGNFPLSGKKSRINYNKLVKLYERTK